MLTWVIISVLLLSSADAAIRWPFQSDDVTTSWGGLVLQAQIGTPARSVKLVFGQETNRLYLGIPSTANIDGGVYNPNASSTFRQTKIISQRDVYGESGTDTFVIGGSTVKNMPFNVYDQNKDYDFVYGSVSVAYSNDANSNFIQAVLRTQPQRTATLSFDTVGYNNQPSKVSGTLTLGSQASECSTQWTRVKEVPYKDNGTSWAFNADTLTVGNYQKRKPVTAVFYLGSYIFDVAGSAYDNIKRQLGGNSDGPWIPCDTTTKIVLSVGGIVLEVGPETYLYKNDDGKCKFAAGGEYGDEFYTLPTASLKDLCIMYDYSTKEVAFAKRLR